LVGAVTGTTACEIEALLDTVCPLGSVLVATEVTLPGETVESTVRSIVFPLAVVITCWLTHVPGAVLESMDLNVSCFPLERVIVPPDEMTPGAVRVEVPCQLGVAPLGRVAVPLKVPEWVALFQLCWDSHVPFPPAAFVQAPFVVAEPLETVVVDEPVPEAPPLVE
jgi:hypothetical protein